MKKKSVTSEMKLAMPLAGSHRVVKGKTTHNVSSAAMYMNIALTEWLADHMLQNVKKTIDGAKKSDGAANVRLSVAHVNAYLSKSSFAPLNRRVYNGPFRASKKTLTLAAA